MKKYRVGWKDRNGKWRYQIVPQSEFLEEIMDMLIRGTKVTITEYNTREEVRTWKTKN